MGCFIDTTLVVAATQKDSSWYAQAESYAAAHKPAEVPYYAHREFMAGVVSIVCTAHNKIKQSPDAGRAIFSVLRLPLQSGRTREGQLKAIADSLSKALSFPGVSTEPMAEETRRQMCQNLALETQRQWRKSKKLKDHERTQPLGCFHDGDLMLDSDGLLKGPGGRFGCDPDSRCAAAQYLYEKQQDLKILSEALRPEKDAVETTEKNETRRRRAALKDLIQNGPADFNKRNCRALGDAYFAVMCPPGSHVLTTNLVDHVRLCEALGKSALDPT